MLIESTIKFPDGLTVTHRIDTGKPAPASGIPVRAENRLRRSAVTRSSAPDSTGAGASAGQPEGTGASAGQPEGGGGSRADRMPVGNEFYMQKQRQDKWCWAAVAASVDHYFSPHSRQTQCQIAQKVNGNMDGDKSRCCTDPEPCNQPANLADALRAVGRYRDTVPKAFTFEEVQAEIDAGRPVCVAIKWRDGGGHFVAISGYRLFDSGVRHLEISDPFYPDSTVPYDQFIDGYGAGESSGAGEWTHTFLLNDQPSADQPRADKKEASYGATAA